MKVKAYAKVNFTLAITGVRDGFHMLDSVVSTVDIYDVIEIIPRQDNEINLIMNGCPEDIPLERNNAYRAAKGYVSRFACRGADITVTKNIPVGGGLGGSSADVAGVLNGMNALYRLADYKALKELADSLGSDTGYLLGGGFARLKGRGEIVEKLPFGGKLHMLLLLPEKGVSTAECYRLYDETAAEVFDSDGAVKALEAGNIAEFARNMNNALFFPAAMLNGDVARAREELLGLNALGVNMTGSGSGVYGIFLNKEECERARKNYKGNFRCEIISTVQA